MIRRSLILPLLILAACESKDLASNPAIVGNAVIYGEDTRHEVSADDLSFPLASATVMIFDGTKKSFPTLKDSYPLCENEPFQDQKRIGYCSGVLVAPNKILTAAHCMQETTRCEDGRFVFGATLKAKDLPVYSCKSILAMDRTLDFAIVELDRPVVGISPVKIASNFSQKSGDPVLSLSYPLGISLKQDKGQISEANNEDNYFKANVDTFAGSSGSPLFNRTGELIGILSMGADDVSEDDIYRVQTRGGCINFNRCNDGTCRGEKFLKTSLISDKI